MHRVMQISMMIISLDIELIQHLNKMESCSETFERVT